MTEHYMTLDELVKELHISKGTVYNWRKRGVRRRGKNKKLRALATGPASGGRLIFRRQDVDSFLLFMSEEAA